MARTVRHRSFAALAALSLLAACSEGGESSAGGAAPADSTAPSPAAAPDTAAAAMQHAPARDADQEFLRMMVDHHQGLIAMAQQAMERGSTEAVKTEAHELHTKQEAEQKEMLGILQRDYQDTHQPTAMPKHRAMADSLAAKSGTDYDMAFRMNVVAHHREGIQMTDRFLPRLTRPDVKPMAERMKTDQQKDIQKLESEMGHG